MNTTRRKFLTDAGFASTAVSLPSFFSQASAAESAKGRKSLFDGESLSGWTAIPRLPLPPARELAKLPIEQWKEAVFQWNAKLPEGPARIAHTGRWEVIDGAIVGGHEPADSLFGAYLLSNEKFGNFELELDAHHDWPIDTGVVIRARDLGNVGFQILMDTRPGGGVGGVYGNNIGNFIAAPFVIDGDSQRGFQVANMREGTREKILTIEKIDFGATLRDFLRVWRPNDWNHFRIRCVGRIPTISTWINGEKMFELDTSRIDLPGYDPEAVFAKLGPTGHLALEVHDVNLKNPLGKNRWAAGAVCRWKNIFVTEL